MVAESVKHEKDPNIFILALKHFPMGFLTMAIGIALIFAPLLYSFFCRSEIDSLFLQIVLTVSAIVIIPFILLYGITLIRVPVIRRNMQSSAEYTMEISSWDLEDIQLSALGEGEPHQHVIIEMTNKLTIELGENT